MAMLASAFHGFIQGSIHVLEIRRPPTVPLGGHIE